MLRLLEQVLSVTGPLISAFIDICLFYNFFDRNYRKRFQKKWFYRITISVVFFILAAVNYYQITLLNFTIGTVICCVFGLWLYYDEKAGKMHTFEKALLLFLSGGLSELVGFFLLKLAMNSMHTIIISVPLYSFLNLTVTKILHIILYFTIFRKMLGKNKLRKLSYWYYMTYFFLVLMNVLSTFVVISAIEYVKGGWEAVIIILNLITIMIINLYILSLLDSFAENTELKVQLAIFEQQEKIQEKYYVSLNERYNQSLKVLHDVDKHINVIERLYQKGQSLEAIEYTKDISKMLLPLVPKKYINNNILNIILNDKAEIAKKNGIEFRCCMEDTDYSFMHNADITTIFSNLLDNAIEACLKKESERYIDIKTMSHNDSMLVIEIKNSIGERPVWQEGRPVSQKGQNHGIGLKNVEKVAMEYSGSIDFEINDNEFLCNVLLNK